MIIGYGYRRRERTLRDAGAERVWLDTERHRPELQSLCELRGMAVRSGDIFLLIAPVDLGPDWRLRRRRLKLLADMGVPVQIRGSEPVLYDTAEKREAFRSIKSGPGEKPVPTKPMGRPRVFKPTPEQDATLRELWNAPGLTRAWRVERASDIMQQKVKYWWLRDRYKENT